MSYKKEVTAPLGMPSWYIYSSALAHNEHIRENFQLDGNFTFVKNFNARTRAVSSKFFIVNNDNGDSIRVYNSGYTTYIYVDVAGEELYSNSFAADVIFTGLTDTILFIEVDYDKEEIRFTHNTEDTFTYSITGLNALKDVLFTDIELGINAYESGCRYSFIMRDLFNYTKKSKVLTSNLKFPLVNVMGRKRGDIKLTEPTSFDLSDNLKTFSGTPETVTYSYAELNALDTGTNKYSGHRGMTIDEDAIYYNPSKNITLKYSFSIDVGTAPLSFKKVTTSVTHSVRLINRDTGAVTDLALSTDEYEIPVGNWTIEITGEGRFTSYGLNSFNYMFGWGSAQENATLTVYNDLEITTSTIVLSAIPQNANYIEATCPFTGQKITGNWGLSPDYS